MMDRFLMDKLIAWKHKSRRKPHILNGARQVGKTWLLREFGRTQFKNTAYVNLDDNPRMREQFDLGYDIGRLISAIMSAENSSGEIDFLTQDANSVYAIEVEAEENLRSKRLRAFRKSHPTIKSLRFSLSGYREQDWMRNIPLYAMANVALWG